MVSLASWCVFGHFTDGAVIAGDCVHTTAKSWSLVGTCDDGLTTGERCSYARECKSGLCANIDPFDRSTTCIEPPPMPNQRARQKRRIDLDGLRKRFMCPRGLTACQIDGFAGYECIDTTSSLEHCGGCKNAAAGDERGLDCSDLGEYGALSVACVDLRCIAECFAAPRH